MLHLQKLLIPMVRSHGRTTMKSAMEESQVLCKKGSISVKFGVTAQIVIIV